MRGAVVAEGLAQELGLVSKGGPLEGGFVVL